jgi:hypothetical protein
MASAEALIDYTKPSSIENNSLKENYECIPNVLRNAQHNCYLCKNKTSAEYSSNFGYHSDSF